MTAARVTARNLPGDGPSVAIALLRRAVETANHVPFLRACGRVVVRLLVKASFAVLRGSPRVRAVYLRGSHARGTAEPFASDVDVAIRLRDERWPPTLESADEVLRRLRLARRINPLIRDAWQFVAGEAEWPLLARHATLVGLDEWQDEHGRKPDIVTTPVADRLHLAAAWNRQHLWTWDAVRRLLAPGHRGLAEGLAFAAAEKKALTYASQILDRVAPSRRESPPRTEAAWLDRATALLIGLNESAVAVSSRVPMSPAAERRGDPFVEARSAATIAACLAETFDVRGTFSRVLLHAGSLVFVTREPLTPRATRQTLAALSEITERLGRRCMLHSPASFALAPLLHEIAVVTLPAEDAALLPGLLREQLFYEALFLGADLRLLADRPAPSRGFPLLTSKLARSIVYFRDGRLIRADDAVMARVAQGEPEIEECLGGKALTAPQWFGVNARLWGLLLDLLESEARRPASDAEKLLRAQAR